ncbi:Transcription cofactor vestigial-like protein 2 [Dissostichus eleginoides]|uniref:Transcription cofactor vestigial-like protein 2 n=1 Tax=Dissostichus eleginoides TaxID=100907 RepID=A0AAD9B3A2_DISEL|nr:Transcription cofactor vestigial-like protein 2 [Dissostichus eleginoides]
MSCLDVMYQVFGPQPYFSSYSPYHHQKLALYTKMQDPQDSRLGPPAIKEEDKELPPGAEYLSSRCVLFTYFQGDISAVVDEHFSRALSHTPAYPASSSHKARSFPPSFWNSSYQPSSSLGSALSSPHSELSFPGDPYASSSSLGRYRQPGIAYPRPGVHEMYSTAFDPRYGSLLVPSVRNHHRMTSGSSVPSASPCDLGGKGESGTSSWSGAFTGAGAEIGLNMDTGLQAQDKSKDLYWF